MHFCKREGKRYYLGRLESMGIDNLGLWVPSSTASLRAGGCWCSESRDIHTQASRDGHVS